MKHPALKMFIVSVCFLPLVLIAGELPAPTDVEVINISYEKTNILVKASIALISIGVYRWKKR